MATLQKYDLTGEKSGELELNDSFLNASANAQMIKEYVVAIRANARQWSASTKGRSEVNRSRKKPHKQKGTGRARAGSNRSPLWKGGGVIFGPKPKTLKFKLNQKERKLSLQTLLYSNRNNICVIENLEESFVTNKSKDLIKIIKNLKLSLNEKLLIIVSNKTEAIRLSSRNLKNVELISASNLNTLSLIKSKNILVTVSALNDIKEIYCD